MNKLKHTQINILSQLWLETDIVCSNAPFVGTYFERDRDAPYKESVL